MCFSDVPSPVVLVTDLTQLKSDCDGNRSLYAINISVGYFAMKQ